MRSEDHGRDAHATFGNAHTRSTGVSPVSASSAHGRDAHATLEVRQGAYLPHWTMTTGGVYAVTFRLADSLPRSVLERLVKERDELVAAARKIRPVFPPMKNADWRICIPNGLPPSLMPEVARAG